MSTKFCIIESAAIPSYLRGRLARGPYDSYGEAENRLSGVPQSLQLFFSIVPADEADATEQRFAEMRQQRERTSQPSNPAKMMVFLMLSRVSDATGCTKDEARDALIHTLGDCDEAIQHIRQMRAAT